MATVIHRGDLIRTLLSGIIVMITVLLIAAVRTVLYRYGAQRRL